MQLSAISLALTRAGFIAEFTPLSLFANGEVGAWYDPSDVDVNWRRNLLTYTEEFDNAAWTGRSGLLAFGSGSVANTTDTEDPLGGNTADFLAMDGSTGTHTLRQDLTSAQTGFGHSRIRLKYKDWQYFCLQGPDATTAVVVDVLNGVVVSNGASATGISVTKSADGWVDLQFATNQSRYYILLFNNGPTYSTSFAGTSGAGIYIWGAQLELGSTATDYQRIVTPEITYIADVQPQPILYQDSAGTTPVTAVEQPVGLMLDKSQGLVFGPDIQNGGFDTDTDWTKTGNWQITGGVAESIPSGNGQITQDYPSTLTVGTWVEVNFTLIARNSGFLYVYVAGNNLNAASKPYSVPGTYRVLVPVLTVTNNQVGFVLGNSPSGFVIDNVSFRELPGNHAYQATSTARPTLSARYNLLEYTEQFDNAYWTKSNVTLSEGETSSSVVVTASSANGSIYRLVSGQIAGTNATIKIQIRRISGTGAIKFKTVNNSTNTVSVTSEWQTFSQSGTLSSTNLYFVIEFSNIGDAVEIRYPDARLTNDGVDLPVYQRVAAATDYDTVGFPTYLKFDGVDDSMATNSIDFTGTDKMTVWAGVRKLSDDSRRMIFESNPSIHPSYGIEAPSAANPEYVIKYTTTSAGVVRAIATTYAAPITNVISGSYDLTQSTANNAILPRINAEIPTMVYLGTPVITDKFSNSILYIGSRAGTSLRHNGRIYSLIVRGAESTATEITDTEDWINNVTKAWS